MRALTVVSLISVAAVAAAQHSARDDSFGYDAPRFLSGKTPEQPPLASTGGLTILELDIAPSGIATDAIVLDEASPFTEVIQKAAVLWRYRPVRDRRCRHPLEGSGHRCFSSTGLDGSEIARTEVSATTVGWRSLPHRDLDARVSTKCALRWGRGRGSCDRRSRRGGRGEDAESRGGL